jgi:predicted nucleic-acid-binding Zn-ribbon protein
MSLGSFQIKAVNKETDKLQRKDFDKIISVCRKYVQGTIQCSGCDKEIQIVDIAGQYFAGRYCKHCWETKYRAIEAAENYE